MAAGRSVVALTPSPKRIVSHAVLKTTKQVNGKVENSTHAPSKTRNRSSPKLAWVITSRTPTSVQNFITKRSPLLPPPLNMRRYASSDSAIAFFGSSFSLQPRPLRRISRCIRQMTSFCARMCHLGVPKTKFYMSTPCSHKKR